VITPGIHDLDEATYHGDPCPEPSLSSSIGKVLIGRSPRHAWCKHPRLNPQPTPTGEPKFDLGSAFHRLMLGKGADIAEVPYGDWRTNAAKEARDAARAEGRIPMLTYQLAETMAMVETVWPQIRAHRDANKAFAAGLAERTLVWREDNGIWCRAMLDWMPESGTLYPDLKSTEGSASPDSWGRRTMFDIGCDFQDAFYRRGLRKLGICDEPFLLFVVAELDHPYMIATHRVAPASAAMADRKVEAAVQLWGKCLERNRWPGYQAETAWHDVPPWKESEWLEREGMIDRMIEGAA